jgi:hypothetical protein
MGRELNKGEASHDLSRFLCFGKEGALAGKKIASGFVESAINQVVSKRMVKKQQMGWSQRGVPADTNQGARRRAGESPSGAGIRISALKGKPRKRRDPPGNLPLSLLCDRIEPSNHVGSFRIINFWISLA